VSGMAQLEYEEFQLKIEPEADGYRVDLLASPFGKASSQFQMPTLKTDLEAALSELHVVRRGARSTRKLFIPGLEPQASGGVKALGAGLFSAVFSGKVGELYQQSLQLVQSQNKGLRIQLHTTANVPELPWEYLRDPIGPGRFLFHSEQITLARYLGLDQRAKALVVKAPLRILVMISNPNGVPALEVQDEWNRLQQALKTDIQQNRVILHQIPATLEELSQALGNQEYHVLHFIGHGGFDEKIGGLLLLEDQQKDPRTVDAETLASQLQDERSLRLVVLNACESARTSAKNPFAGVAQTLIESAGSISAVIAMQYEISDDVAIAFAERFYGSIARALPVDTALADARKTIFGLENGKLEFGIPVLYMHSSDGQLFDLQPPPASAPEFLLPQLEPQANIPVPSVQQPQPWWQMVAIGIVVSLAALVAYLTLGQPVFTTRKPTANEILTLSKLSDFRSPKVSTDFPSDSNPINFKADVDAQSTYLWGGVWCRRNQELLDANLKHIQFSLLVNDKPLNESQYLVYQYTDTKTKWRCQGYKTILQALKPNISLNLTAQAVLDQSITMQLSDTATKTYETGIHQVKFFATFK
jgi:CHAT domain